jgi:peptidoglycan/LPS O-acetylase OafA/YrhL
LALFIVLENRGARSLQILRGPTAAFFAKTSYAAYMVHHVVIYILFAATGQARTVTTLAGLAITGIAIVLTFAICALSYRYFETPLIAFGHRKFSFGKPISGTWVNLSAEETRPGSASSAGMADNGQAPTRPYLSQ